MKYVSKIQKDIQIQVSSNIIEVLERLGKNHTIPNLIKVDFDSYLVKKNEYPKFQKLLKSHDILREDRIAIKTILNSIHKVILSDIFTYTNIDSFDVSNHNIVYQIYSKRYDEYYQHASFEVYSDYDIAMRDYRQAQELMPSYEWSLQRVHTDDIENLSVID